MFGTVFPKNHQNYLKMMFSIVYLSHFRSLRSERSRVTSQPGKIEYCHCGRYAGQISREGIGEKLSIGV